MTHQTQGQGLNAFTKAALLVKLVSLCFKIFAKCINFKISTLNQPSKSKHLKARFGPRVRDVTFFNHGGRLGPRVHNMTFLDALASLRSMLESHRVINVFEFLSNLGLIIRVCSE